MPNIDANDIDVGIPICSTMMSLKTNIIMNNVVDNTHDSVSKVFASFFIINLFRLKITLIMLTTFEVVSMNSKAN